MDNRFQIPDRDLLLSCNPMDHIAEQLYRSYRDMLDRMTYDAFARYGYSKEWIEDRDNMGRVTGEVINKGSLGDCRIFKIDGIPLFSLTTTYPSGKDYEFNYFVSVNTEYLAPLPEEGSNEKQT